MSKAAQADRQRGACTICRRRSWLLSALGPSLDYCARDRDRLSALLSLNDRALVQAVGGRRRAELSACLDAFVPADACPPEDAESVCIHRRGYPAALRGIPWSPRALNVAGATARLTELTSAPGVAIVGSPRASDYGVEMARSMGRGLAASGVTVVGALSDGIAVGALSGSLDGGKSALAVVGHGLGVCRPARRRPLLARVVRSGCAVSELPHDCPGRRWGAVAAERIIVGIASLVVVVEAENRPGELALAGVAKALGRPVAAIPGRLTSPLSSGTHALLREDATLVRGVEDVLDLLHDAPGADSAHLDASSDPPARRPELEPGLASILAQVGAGRDTPDALTRPGVDAEELLLALSELELLGLLKRGDGGRYVPRQPE